MAGAAVSISTSLADLAHTGAESVRTAFRLGVYVDEISRKLESRELGASLDSWAYVVAEKTQEEVQRELDLFNTETVCLRTSQSIARNYANSLLVESRAYQSLHQRC